MIIDHIGLAVSDYDESKRFFCRALAPLGIEPIMEVQGWAGLGRAGKPEFWFGAGGTDNGPPGLREVYHPDYFGAFVLGPDGHNVEAVCHRPEP